MRRFLAVLTALCFVMAGFPCLAEAQEESPILHYLVLGRDSYSPSSFNFSRTDTVLLVSLDPAQHQIVLTSILRDSVVTTPKGAQSRINTVFRNHGFEGIKQTVETHLEIQLEGTVVIDFETVKELIDALGGVEIEIDVNEYSMIRSILLGKDPNMPKGPGLVHMTGRIALAYMRDRSSGSGDFSRTERQRKVLRVLLDKCQSLSLPEMLDVYNAVTGGIETDLSAIQLLSAMRVAFELLEGEVVDFHIPQRKTYSYGSLRGSSVLEVNWRKNREAFHQLFTPEMEGEPVETPLPEETPAPAIPG